jgi:hypothetical protein
MDWSHILTYASYVIAAASAIANLTPTDADNAIVNAISQIIHVLALNWTGGASK